MVGEIWFRVLRVARLEKFRRILKPNLPKPSPVVTVVDSTPNPKLGLTLPFIGDAITHKLGLGGIPFIFLKGHDPNLGLGGCQRIVSHQ